MKVVRDPKPFSKISLLNVVLVILCLIATSTLILQYGGFHLEDFFLSELVLDIIQIVIVAWLITDRFLRLYWSKSRKQFLAHNWLDYALLGVFGIAILIGSQIHGSLSPGAFYLILMQTYLLIMLVMRAISANLKLAGSGLPPSWLLMGSFAGLCLIGAGLLMLPAAVAEGCYQSWNFTDALFTSVSATCVTGLIAVDTGTHFTQFGQAVILCLIQLGGLGIMIFGTMLAVLTGKMLSLRSTETISQMLSDTRMNQLARTVKFVVLITIIIEATGAMLLYPMFAELHDCNEQAMTTSSAVWYSIFHSISAFCNAGFSLYDGSLMDGAGANLDTVRNHWQLLGVFGPLIVFGGLGFIVLQEILINIKNFIARLRLKKIRKRNPFVEYPRVKFSLHSKIVLATTAFLIIVGAGLLFITESVYNSPSGNPAENVQICKDWQQMSTAGKVRECIFQSITARTAGFNSIDMNKLSNAGKLTMCGLMTIGGSPSSTAGGLKTSTIALFFLVIYSALRKRNEIEVFGRTISTFLLKRAVTLTMLYLMLVIFVTMGLCISIKSESFINNLFEACSACGTVGLSTGVTAKLGPFSKYLIITAMFIGRLGPLTLLIGITEGLKPADYSYPRENVTIG